MKNAVKATMVMMMVFTSLSAIAAKPVQIYSSPMQAAEGDHKVKRELRRYLNDGFEMTESFENQYRYITAPVGDHDWGTCIFRLRSSVGGMSLETTYVTVTVYVRYDAAKDGFKVSGFDTFSETVY